MTEVFKSRLQSLSWFMKCLNEPIARKANAEDQCTGHFWEARFHSEPLMSEQALIAAMAYVDLNPIRAKMAKKPEESDYTSIKARVGKGELRHDVKEAISRLLDSAELSHFTVSIKPLKAFSSGNETQSSARPSSITTRDDDLPIYEEEYLELVDITGRILVRGKKGRIEPNVAPILERLNLTVNQWTQVSSSFKHYYKFGHLRLTTVA